MPMNVQSTIEKNMQFNVSTDCRFYLLKFTNNLHPYSYILILLRLEKLNS